MCTHVRSHAEGLSDVIPSVGHTYIRFFDMQEEIWFIWFFLWLPSPQCHLSSCLNLAVLLCQFASYLISSISEVFSEKFQILWSIFRISVIVFCLSLTLCISNLCFLLIHSLPLTSERAHSFLFTTQILERNAQKQRSLYHLAVGMTLFKFPLGLEWQILALIKYCFQYGVC